MLTKRERLAKYIKRMHLNCFGRKGLALPAFIFGYQRSGTNMLFNILNCSKNVEGYRENDEEAYDNFALKNKEVISKLINRSYAKVVLFKPISDSHNSTEILDKYKGSKAIWIYRNYKDATNSALRNWNEHNKYLHYILNDKEKARWRAENISEDNMNLIEKCYNKGISDVSARALIWYIRNSYFFSSDLDKDKRLMLVSYENIINNRDFYLDMIFNFIGLNYDSSYSRFMYNRSINKNSFPEIDLEIQELCDQMQCKFEEISNIQDVNSGKN